MDDGNIGGYKSGHWNVEMYSKVFTNPTPWLCILTVQAVKYQNDHADPVWVIDEDACNWYVNYIAQGCTKGGNRPSDVNDQVSDGGTFYEPLMGSVDFMWKATT